MRKWQSVKRGFLIKQTLPPQLQDERRDDYYIIHDSLSLHVLGPPITTTVLMD